MIIFFWIAFYIIVGIALARLTNKYGTEDTGKLNEIELLTIALCWPIVFFLATIIVLARGDSKKS